MPPTTSPGWSVVASIRREECADDGRGAWVTLTAEGRTAIEAAAPAHVETVRRLVFEALTSEEVEQLAAVIDKVLARLEDQSTSAS